MLGSAIEDLKSDANHQSKERSGEALRAPPSEARAIAFFCEATNVPLRLSLRARSPASPESTDRTKEERSGEALRASPSEALRCRLSLGAFSTLTAYLLHNGSASQWKQRLKPLGVGAMRLNLRRCFHSTRNRLI